MFQNTTSRFAARGILDNFEISLAVLLPNTTTSHAITYTYISSFFIAAVEGYIHLVSSI